MENTMTPQLREQLDALVEGAYARWNADGRPKQFKYIFEMGFAAAIPLAQAELLEENIRLQKTIVLLREHKSQDQAQISELQEKFERNSIAAGCYSLEVDEEKSRSAKLIDALNSIIARSHSWIITERTGAIEAPIHASYRKMATSAIAEYEGEK